MIRFVIVDPPIMIKHIILYSFFISPLIVLGQNRDLTWFLGALPAQGYTVPGIDYSNGFADTFTTTRTMSFFITEASICDTTGKVLFYTNGLTIDNINDEHLLNGSDFNPGYSTDFYEDLDDIGLGFCQGAIVIPKPGSVGTYEVLYVSGEEITISNNYYVQPLHLSVSEINMNLDGGLGGIVAGKKNVHIIEDTLSQGRITACKHANGIDWWILTHKYYSDMFYKILVTADTILVKQQSIGSIFKSNDVNGMAVFSPDGSKYANVNFNDTLELYNFNRCTGDLSDVKMLTLPYEGYNDESLGCSFSPNNRFLYVDTYTRIFQFDTWADDAQASIIKVAQWDTSFLPFATYFFIQQLAPDNKIYISPFAGIYILHTIESPDSLGIACNVLQHSYQLPSIGCAANSTLPNFPNYDLGALPGGDTCNAVYTTHTPPVTPISNFRISPNPATTWLNIVYETSADGLFELFDINAKRVAATSLYHYFKNRLIDVSNLPAGVYLATVTQNGKQVWKEKVVILH
jgi:hypothetical protein